MTRICQTAPAFSKVGGYVDDLKRVRPCAEPAKRAELWPDGAGAFNQPLTRGIDDNNSRLLQFGPWSTGNQVEVGLIVVNLAEGESTMSWNEEANIRCLLMFKCPALWSRLAETNSPDRRHCEECNRDVFLVRHEKDFARHASQAHCVAVPIKGDVSFPADNEVLTGSPIQVDIVELQ